MRIARIACRVAGIAIAVAGVADPAFTVTHEQPQAVTTVDLTVNGPVDHRVSCDPRNPCVVLADGSKDAEIPSDLTQPLTLERRQKNVSPDISIRSAVIAAAPHVGAAGVVRVALDGRGVAGRKTDVTVRDGDIVIGAGVMEWQADGGQTMDIAWWPVAAGARTLRIEAAVVPGEPVAFDNAVDIGADVSHAPAPVLFFDARPSWSSTFVRRALEDDPRFLVEHRARVAPAISAGTSSGRLDAPSLNAAHVLVVGAPDALTAADVDLVERFVRVRGGVAVLLPERMPEGPSLRLFEGRWVEELISEPRAAGPLRASELLRPRQLPPASVAIAPDIIATPAGAGRIIISGAMDAWRHRDASASAFDTFWRSVTAEAAVHGQRLRVQFEAAMARPGARHAFTIRYRSMDGESMVAASAIARCDQGPAQTIRLWPTGIFGSFRGELPIGDARSCTVEATVNEAQATAAVAVAEAPAPIAHAVMEKFAREARLRAVGATARPAQALQADVHPMRSPLWIVPFAGLLSIEWWLRRRGGLR